MTGLSRTEGGLMAVANQQTQGSEPYSTIGDRKAYE